MKERPIIFSAPMVRAVLGGKKTQTRRIIKTQPSQPFGGIFHDGSKWWTGDSLTGALIETLRVPYAVGDRLWVREAWRTIGYAPLSECVNHADIHFRASASEAEEATFRWRPSIHMPRWASRITLRVTEVRVEQLQEISQEDAKAEGMIEWQSTERPCWAWYLREPGLAAFATPQAAFATLWRDIYGPGSWDQNPWVAAITFERIDA